MHYKSSAVRTQAKCENVQCTLPKPTNKNLRYRIREKIQNRIHLQIKRQICGEQLKRINC